MPSFLELSSISKDQRRNQREQTGLFIRPSLKIKLQRRNSTSTLVKKVDQATLNSILSRNFA